MEENFPDTPTNIDNEVIELYHSISKGETVNKNFHAGTYNAALDRASQFYGGEQLYKIANDNLDFIQDQANDLISELSEEVSFEKVEDFYEVTDGMVTREITITLPTGVEADFNIVAETFDNNLTIKFQDLEGYDGAEIYKETLSDIEIEPDNLESITSTVDITGDELVAEGLLDEIGLKKQAGEFNYKDGYDLYKVNIKPGANVVNIPDTAIFVENGIKKEMSSDFIQGFIERPETVNKYTGVTQIIIDGKTYDITDTFTSAQALQEHFKGADVLVYNNDIEDVGSKSYMFLNENSYVLEKIDDTQFNIDVANKYIKNNPYETISKLARREASTKPERYQVLLNALLDEPETPTNIVDEVVVTSATDNLKQAIPTNADGNIVIYRATTDPNVNILSDFTDINMSNQAGLGQQSFYAIDEMYAYNYSRPSINKNVYKFETNIKPSQVLNIQSPTNAQISVLEKIGITSQDLKNWDMFNTGEVNTKIQNNLDFLLENNIKAIGNNKVGGSPGVFDYEIVPIITEKTQTEIKPVSQLILDPNWEGTDRILNVENELFQSTQSTQWADKYLPIDVNDPNTKYRPVYYVDEEGIGRKAKDFQFSEQPIENNLVKDNLIEVPVDTNTNVNLVNDTYVLSTDTLTNVVDDIAQLENSLNEKYSDVLEFNYNAFGDEMASTKPLQIGLREDGVLGIDVISVSDSAQGQGYGSSIMNEIIEFADKNNLEIQLEPLEGQEEFFTKLGFEQFGDDEAEYRKLPTTISDNIAQQVDVQDVRIYFNEAYNKFNEEYMPWNYFENFLINEKELSEDVAKGIIDDIKVGLTKPEFTNFPQSTFDPNLFPKAGTNFDSAVSRNMFNSTQVQRELSAKYILEDVEDYLNLSEEQSTKLANTFYEGINPRTTGTVEFYVQQQSPNRILAGDVKSGLDMTHQVPGFYTEPIGNRSLSAIRGVGSNAPINNYYKVQVNTDNLLVDIAPARFAGTQGPLVSEGDNVLGRQINKINWDTFTKETGITYEMLGTKAKIIDGQKYYTGSVMDLSRSLNTFQPNRNITGATSTLSKTNVWEALRKSGIEGFVTGPTNVQYEIVFLDPNDNLGIGKRMNIQDATVQEFQTNKAAVTQLDELVIQPKPVTELNTYNQEDLNKLGNGNQIVDQSKVTQLDETTNAFKTQSNDIVQKLPIEKEVKDKIAKNIAELQVKWTTWSGPLELLDIYETGVMLFYGVVAAAPELKSYANTLMKDMYNTMIEFSGMENYGMKKLSGSDYEPNWSYIGEQIDKAEKIMPSEMLIKTIKEGAEVAGEENLMTGFGYIPPSLDTRKKLQTTLSNPKTPEKEDTGPSTYDKIKDTIGEWWKKPLVVYDR